MRKRALLSVSAVFFASLIATACEDSGSGGGSGTFDGGGSGFDSGSPSVEGGPTGDDAAVGADGGDDGGNTQPPPTTANDVYVDPTAGLDTNTGKSGSPFKTITKAFSVVPSGAGVHLLDGTYDGANEAAGTVTIPDGVNVRAENPGQAKLTAITVQTSSGATALYDLAFVGQPKLNASGTAKLLGARLTFAPTGNNIMSVKDTAEITLSGGSLDGQGTGGPVEGDALFNVTGTGTLTLDGTMMKNSHASGIFVSGTSAAAKAKLVVKNGAVLDGIGVGFAIDCFGLSIINTGSFASVLIDHATLQNAPAAGVCIGETVDVTLQNGTTISGNYYGLSAQDYITTDNSSATVRNTTFTNNLVGISWRTTGKVDVAGSAFTAAAFAGGVTTEAIEILAGAPQATVTVRSTTTRGARYGVYVGNSAVSGATLTADLGTTADPGKNDFSGVTESGVYMQMPDGTTVDAQGNTWNAGAQGADGTGKYPAGTTITGPASGTNYSLTGASTLNL